MMNKERFAEKTGRSWEQWLAFLGEIGAADLPHRKIAGRIVATGDANGWWAQSVTVAFEQHIGRRVPGQRSDGAFEVSVTRAVPGTMDAVLNQWKQAMNGRTAFGGVGITEGPNLSASEKWRYWRCALEDGTRVSVTINQKTPDKAGLAVTHEKLASEVEKERWRAFWKDVVISL
ncbi:hypothetical protein [Pelagibacterium halotolerans]|uniref:hypothetical protein n=1 Tax=Pelagibacterium halotolerans TaxID=531813 RepID=UPI00384D8952